MRKKKGNTTGKIMMAVMGVMLAGSSMAAASAYITPYDDVPQEHWSYSSVQQLAQDGVIKESIAAGQVLNRSEMAVMTAKALSHYDNASQADKEIIDRLRAEYTEDLKAIGVRPKAAPEVVAPPVLPPGNGEVKTKSKADDFFDRFSMNGNARFRIDHLFDHGGKHTEMSHVNVALNTTYKVNDNWDLHTNIEYRRSLQGIDNGATGDNFTNGVESDCTDGTISQDLFLTGRLKEGVGVKVGKWYEWNPEGFGMDRDSKFVGGEIDKSWGKLHVTASAGKVDLWDAKGLNSLMDVNIPGVWNADGIRRDEDFAGIRFGYAFDPRNQLNFGVHAMSPMAGPTHRQDPNQGRVKYWFLNGRHTFDSNWTVLGGIAGSNAKPDPNVQRWANMGILNYDGDGKLITKGVQYRNTMAFWLRLQYKQANPQKPGSYDIWATYRREPGMTMPDVSEWWSPGNNEALRVGFDYVLDKNIILNGFYSSGHNIDTRERNDRTRMEVDVFF